MKNIPEQEGSAALVIYTQDKEYMYQVIRLNSQGNLLICNPDAVLLFIKYFIWESDKWSIRCNISRLNFPLNILYFLLAVLFILYLDICSYTPESTVHLRNPEDQKLQQLEWQTCNKITALKSHTHKTQSSYA